jgi:hypothetical protein
VFAIGTIINLFGLMFLQINYFNNKERNNMYHNIKKIFLYLDILRFYGIKTYINVLKKVMI